MTMKSDCQGPLVRWMDWFPFLQTVFRLTRDFSGNDCIRFFSVHILEVMFENRRIWKRERKATTATKSYKAEKGSNNHLFFFFTILSISFTQQRIPVLKLLQKMNANEMKSLLDFRYCKEGEKAARQVRHASISPNFCSNGQSHGFNSLHSCWNWKCIPESPAMLQRSLWHTGSHKHVRTSTCLQCGRNTLNYSHKVRVYVFCPTLGLVFGQRGFKEPSSV